MGKGPRGAPLIGCPHLGNEKGQFVIERVITEDNFRECPDWIPIGHRQAASREKLFGLTGLNVVRTLYQLPDIVMDDVRQGEKDELMLEEIPDFDGMLVEGMPDTERSEQLRYETEDDGQIIVETDKEGNEYRRARPSHQLKAYATLPEEEGGHICLSARECMMWTNEQLITHIVKTEIEQGLITKTKKTRSKAKARSAPQSKAAEPQQNRETQKMATQGRRVRATRTAGGAKKPSGGGKARVAKGKAAGKAAGKSAPAGKPPAKGGGRVARPPRKAGAPAAAAPEKSTAASPGGAGVEEIAAAVANILGEKFGMQHKELMMAIHELKNTVEEKGAANIDAITAMHDMAAQTCGTFAYPKDDDEGNIIGGMLRFAIDPEERNITLVEDDPPSWDEDGNQVGGENDGAIVVNPLPQLLPKPSKILGYIDETAWEGEGEEAGEEEEEAGEE